METPFNYEKHIRQIPIKGYPAEYLTSHPQNCQGHPNKKSLRTCHSQEEPRGLGVVTTKCNEVSGMDS